MLRAVAAAWRAHLSSCGVVVRYSVVLRGLAQGVGEAWEDALEAAVAAAAMPAGLTVPPVQTSMQVRVAVGVARMHANTCLLACVDLSFRGMLHVCTCVLVCIRMHPSPCCWCQALGCLQAF